MLHALSPYIGFTAAGLALVILVADRLLHASRARADVAAAPATTGWPDADITQRLPAIVVAQSTATPTATPPLPPAAFRRLPAPPERPRCRPPDRPANPRSDARLMTPWGDLTRLPGSDEPGIVPSLLVG